MNYLKLFEESLVRCRYSQRTRTIYLYQIRNFLKYMKAQDFEQIGKKEIDKYLYICTKEKEYSLSTIKQIVGAINLFYREVLKKELNYYYGKNIRKSFYLPTVLSIQEVQRIIGSCANLKHKTLLVTIYSLGIRLSEVLHLKVTDIDSDRMEIHIRQAKGSRDRTIFLPKNLLKILREYFAIYKPKNYLFEGRSGKEYSRTSVQNILKKALKNSKIKKTVSAHTLRHSFATHLLEQGTDIRFIQELLGHKNIATTQLYTKITTSSLKNIKSPIENIKL